jgi:high frequency lysogenization protein
MKENKLTNITLALAGVMQAVYLINELARHGNANEDALAVSLNSITKLESDNVAEIFGNQYGLRLGLTELNKLLLQPTHDSKKDLLRYVISVFTLSKRLLGSPLALQKLRENLENIQRQISYFSHEHEVIINNLAEAYIEVQSEIKQRIIVLGKEHYLKTNDIQNKVRALLLAALRSAVLWRQLGGSRWQLLLQRKQLLKTCQQLIQEE